MFRRLILMVVVLGFSTTLFGEVNPDTLPEKYVKKVIIEAKWGSGPGEFGIVPYPKSDPPVGPRDFYVDGNGNIYVLDQVNHRVEVFDRSGVYKSQILYNNVDSTDSLAIDSLITVADIAADDKGNIYILGALEYPSKNGLIRAFDKKGNFLTQVILPEDLFMPSLEEFKRHGGYYGFGQLLGGLEEFKIEDEKLFFSFEDKTYFLGETSLFKSKYRDVAQELSVRPLCSTFLSNERQILDLFKRKNESIIQFLGRDKENNLFIQKSNNMIMKFDSSGKMLATIKIPYEPAKYDMGKSLFVSDEGNIYYWTNDEKGLRIVRLSKEGGGNGE